MATLEGLFPANVRRSAPDPSRPGGSRGSLPRASRAIAPRWLGAPKVLSARRGVLARRGPGTPPRPHCALSYRDCQREPPGARPCGPTGTGRPCRAPVRVSGELLPGLSGRAGLSGPYREPPWADSTWAGVRTAGRQPPARHASAGTAGRMATSPGSRRRQAQKRCHTPLLSSGNGRCGVCISTPRCRELNGDATQCLQPRDARVNGQIAPRSWLMCALRIRQAAGSADGFTLPLRFPAQWAGRWRAAQTAFSPLPSMVHPQEAASAATICRP